MSKALLLLLLWPHLSATAKNKSRILSATSTEPAAKLHQALATESDPETVL